MSRNSSKSIPLYQKVYLDLKAKLNDNVFPQGSMLPYEKNLCATYGVDRVTVRRALEMLADEALVEKRPGVGSFVTSGAKTRPKAEKSSGVLFVMSRSMNDVDSNPSAYNSTLFYAIGNICTEKGMPVAYSVIDDKNGFDACWTAGNYIGVLFASYIPPDILKHVVNKRIPALCLNNYYEKIISIIPDNEGGTRDAVEHLIRRGHRRIGIVKGSEGYHSATTRCRSFMRTLSENGIPICEELLLQSDWTFEGAHEAVSNMLRSLSPQLLPSALFCSSDVLALGTINAIKEAGLDVPGDISVIGFDGIKEAAYLQPHLTTMTVDVSLMAKLAVNRLFELSDSYDDRAYVVQLPPMLTVRQSVADFDTKK